MAPLPGDYAVLPVSGVTGLGIRIGEFLNGDGFRNYEHAEIYVGHPDEKSPLGYTMGAYPGGARLKPVPAGQPGWLWSTGHIALTEAQRQSIVIAAINCAGIPYSWVDYAALAARRLHLPVPGLREYIASTRSLICSELVDWCYMRAGVHLFKDGRWQGYVTPESLANLVSP